jgi:hypothetical protein
LACLHKLKKYFKALASESKYHYYATSMPPGTLEAIVAADHCFTVLDPRIKDMLFNPCNSDLFPNSWLHDMRAALIGYTDLRNPTDPDVPATATVEQGAELAVFAGLDMSIVLGAAPATLAPQTIAEELAAYLAVHVDQSVSPLDWWRENKYRYPRLAHVACDVLAIPSMSYKCLLSTVYTQDNLRILH